MSERVREIVHSRLLSCSGEYQGRGHYHTKLCDQLTDDLERELETVVGKPGAWHHIKTAPMDGTRILLFCPESQWSGTGQWDINSYHGNAYSWSQDDGESIILNYGPPLYWMPLPTPPQPQTASSPGDIQER